MMSDISNVSPVLIRTFRGCREPIFKLFLDQRAGFMSALPITDLREMSGRIPYAIDRHSRGNGNCLVVFSPTAFAAG